MSQPGSAVSTSALAGALEGKDVLFIGLGTSAVCWYRCAMPAMCMGADWIGVVGEPPNLRYLTGYVRGGTNMPRYEDYRVVVVQQPRGNGWLRLIRGMQERGISVVFEVDDYLHGIRKMPDHDFRESFGRDELRRLELNMRVCDAVICSTEYIARRYRSFNGRVFVCENGIDTGRYRLTRPQRPTVNVGWAGGTGHARAALPWLSRMPAVMRARERTCFVSIGQNFADALAPMFGEGRCISVPFTLIDNYPAAMCLLDVALAPAGKGAFFRGKSDLRWVEAGALGIPTVADPAVYPNIEHGVTGFHASSPREAEELVLELIDDPKLRLQVGEAAREYVLAHRDMRVAVGAWRRALVEVADLPSGGIG
jgi:glycosyltransferase involved in cell wall biosynthesis